MLKSVDHLSEKDMAEEQGRPTCGVISICNSGRKVPLDLESSWGTVLRVYFDDVQFNWGKYRLFAKDDAIDILEWVEDLSEDIDTLYVHCAQGVSRSAAVARFVAHYYQLPFDEEKGKFYNQLVYLVLLQEAYYRGMLDVERYTELYESESESESGSLATDLGASYFDKLKKAGPVQRREPFPDHWPKVCPHCRDTTSIRYSYFPGDPPALSGCKCLGCGTRIKIKE